ncbi:MAG: SDR family NAD(P)-dependent oxidoreductase [Gammaproteobacteria bacterium]
MKNKVALVTGAQQGIGCAIALAFGREGAHVVVNYLDDEDGALSTAQDIQRHGTKSVCIQGDVTSTSDIARMVDAASDLGGVDVLVNNAAIFPRVDFVSMSEQEWDAVLGVNLKGTFRCTQASVRNMMDHGRGGSVINLASVAAFQGSPRGVHYVASKAGVVGFTRALALELAPHRIRVNAIAPGLTDTAQPRYGMTEEELQSAGRGLPLGRLATPEDIAALAVYLAADESEQVTGQTMHVNGGQHLT